MKNIMTQKNIYLLFIALVVGLFTACDENIHDFAKKTPANATHTLYIADSDLEFTYPVNRTANSEVIGLDTILAKFPVHSTLAVEDDVTVKLEVDRELVDVYNTQHGTHYNFLQIHTITNPTLTINKGQTESADSVIIAYPRALLSLSDRNGYLLPVRIISYGGTDMQINYEKRVSYLKVNVTQQNGVYFKDLESSSKITNNPILGVFGDFNDITFKVSSLFGTEGEAKVTLSVNNSLIQDFNNRMGTEYREVPESDFDPVEVVFIEGAESVEGKLSYKGDVSTLADTKGYVVPLEITSVEGGADIARVNAQRVFYAIIDISNLRSDPVTDPAELGDIEADRSEYKAVNFVNAATGANINPVMGKITDMFTNGSSYFVVQQPVGTKLNITIDLGKEVQNISGIGLEGFQTNVAMNIKAVDIYYATEQAYINGQSNLAGKISLSTGRQKMYIRFSEPVNARYIMLNNMTSAFPSMAVFMLQQFYIYTDN